MTRVIWGPMHPHFGQTHVEYIYICIYVVLHSNWLYVIMCKYM
jgi:hypothetical protein